MGVFCFSAARMPAATPSSSDSTMAVAPMASDTGSALATSSFTDQSA